MLIIGVGEWSNKARTQWVWQRSIAVRARVANSQVGFTWAASMPGGYTLVDSQLFLPAECFDEARRTPPGWRCQEDLTYQTKPEVDLNCCKPRSNATSNLKSLCRLSGLLPMPCGDSPAFRDGIAALDKWYFTEIKSTSQVWLHRRKCMCPPGKGAVASPLACACASQPIKPCRSEPHGSNSCQPGLNNPRKAAKAPLVCDFAFLRVVFESRAGLPGPGKLWLVIRRMSITRLNSILLQRLGGPLGPPDPA